MTTPTYSPATSPAATAKRSQAIDPWDAPYFGGTVYFAYRASATLPQQPALAPSAPAPSMAAATAPERPPLATDPWDAPYFGGPIYLRFPAYRAPAASSEVVAAVSLAKPTTLKRRSWLARLFGR